MLHPGVVFLSGVDDNAEAIVQFGKHTRSYCPDYSKPIKVHLYILKYKGVPVCLGIKNKNFAEFDPRHCYVGDGEFHIEDYILRILEINGVAKVPEKIKSSSEEALQKYGLLSLKYFENVL